MATTQQPNYEREYTKTDYVQWLLDNHPEHFYEYFEEFMEAVK